MNLSSKGQNHMKTIVLLSLALVGLSCVAGWTGFSASGKPSQTTAGDNVLSEFPQPHGIGGPSTTAPQTGTARMSGPLRWVRGTVVSQTSDSLLLKLRDSSMTLSLDAATEIISAGNAAPSGSLPMGSVVQAHYLTRHDERRAVVIFDEPASLEKLSKWPGTSYRGVVKTIRSAAVTIRIDGRTLGLTLDSHTTLVDRTGHTLATGSKAIARLLSAGDALLVTYRVYSDTTMVGDVPVPNYWETALEIRRL
jgi:hypothetical protein